MFSGKTSGSVTEIQKKKEGMIGAEDVFAERGNIDANLFEKEQRIW